MSDKNSREHRLAMILQAMDDLDDEMSNYRTEWKSRMETLRTQASQIKKNILYGQEELPLEPVESKPSDECSTEERARTRKSRKLAGQDAILPDPRKPSDPPPGVQP